MRKKKILENEEHFEARQAEINRERKEYLDALTKPEQKRFKECEKAISILTKNKIPFALWVAPENGGSKFWRFQELTYLKRYSDEDMKLYQDRLKALSFQCLKFFANCYQFIFAIYTKDKMPVETIAFDGYHDTRDENNDQKT